MASSTARRRKFGSDSETEQDTTSGCRRRVLLAGLASSGVAVLAGCLDDEYDLGERGPDGVAAMETTGRVDATPIDSHPEELFPEASAFGEKWEVSSEPKSIDSADDNEHPDGFVAETAGAFVTDGRTKAILLSVRVYESTDAAERGIEHLTDATSGNVKEHSDDPDPFGDTILLVDWVGINHHKSHRNIALFRKANVVVEADISNNEGNTSLRKQALLAILDDIHATWAS